MNETYTLSEAKMELDRRECAYHGHRWDVLETMAGPKAIFCNRCGTSHSIEGTNLTEERHTHEETVKDEHQTEEGTVKQETTETTEAETSEDE